MNNKNYDLGSPADQREVVQRSVYPFSGLRPDNLQEFENERRRRRGSRRLRRDNVIADFFGVVFIVQAFQPRFYGLPEYVHSTFKLLYSRIGLAGRGRVYLFLPSIEGMLKTDVSGQNAQISQYNGGGGKINYVNISMRTMPKFH